MKKYLGLYMWCCFLSVTPCFSALHLHVEQKKISTIPIVVRPFKLIKVRVQPSTRISSVIVNDLRRSGAFNVGSGSSVSQVSTAQLKTGVKAGRCRVSYMVRGRVEAIGKSSLRVKAQLLDACSGAAWFGMHDTHQLVAHSALRGVLFDQSFTIHPSQLRALAHRISDLVYTQLTGNPGIFSTKIAYINVLHKATLNPVYYLKVADQDGANERVLLRSDRPIMSPAWSPDGRRIAYVSFEGNRAAVYVQNIATGARYRVSDSPGINGAPAFSPDGRRLALVLSKTGVAKIYLLDLATGYLQQLTHGYSIDTEPAWAPDGQSIVFTSSRDGGAQIFRYDLKTHAVTRVTFEGAYNARASFLPQGQGLVMLHRDGDYYAVAFDDLKTSSVAVLSQSGYYDSPSLSPNGLMVVYSGQYHEHGVLYMASLDGRVRVRLPALQGDIQDPAWSPFFEK